MKVKGIILGIVLGIMTTTSAMAENIGVSIHNFDDVWTSVLMNSIKDYGKEIGMDMQVEDAKNTVTRQLDQINNFIAAGVDAIIVQPVDTSATTAMTAAAKTAGIPLVYVNRPPVDLENLPDNQAYVSSDEYESGTLQAFEMCKMLRSQGKSGGAKAYITGAKSQ